MRALFLACLACAPALAGAQSASNPSPQAAPAAAAQLQKAEQPDPRRNQKVELIRHEDDGAVIDEVRYAGQAQSVTVQPKARVPAYQVPPGGQRVWNILSF